LASRLTTLLSPPSRPDGWSRTLIDRNFLPIVTTRSSAALAYETPPALRARLAAAGPSDDVEGLVKDVDEAGTPILAAFRRE
jgi:hypothetical protein